MDGVCGRGFSPDWIIRSGLKPLPQDADRPTVSDAGMTGFSEA